MNTKPGISKCALIRQSFVLRSSCGSASVKAFHARLRDVVGGIPGGVVMPCFEPVLMMSPTRCRAIMPGARLHLGAVDNAPEIDAEHPLPVLRGPNIALPRLHSGVVHQNVGAAEAFHGTVASSRVTSSTRLTSSPCCHDVCRTPLATADTANAAAAWPDNRRDRRCTSQAQARERLAAARPMPDAPFVTTATELEDKAGWGKDKLRCCVGADETMAPP